MERRPVLVPLLVGAALGVGAWLFLRPLGFVLVPGFLVFLRPPESHRDLGMRLALATGVSTAFWVVAFWLFKVLGLSYRFGARAAVVLFVAWFVLWVLRQRKVGFRTTSKPRTEVLVLTGLVLVSVARFLPAWTQFCPPGADMSMHTYVAALIERSAAIPDTFEPVLPFGGVANYAPGFHCLMALSRIGSAPPSLLEAGLFVSCWTYAFFGLALYALLRCFASPVAALAGSILVAWGAPFPQDMFATGTNPVVLSLGFAILAASFLLRANRPLDAVSIACTALLLAAVPLTHAIPAVVLLYVALPLGLAAMLRGPDDQPRWILRNGVLIAGLSALLVTVYVWHFDRYTSTVEIRWTREWQQALWPGSVAGLPRFLALYSGKIVLALCGLSWLVLWIAGQGRRILVPTLAAAVLVLLLVNAKFWVLPLSFALYPDRVAIAFTAVSGIFFAVLVDRLQERGFGVIAAREKAGLGAVVLAVAVGVPVSLEHYFLKGRAAQSVTEADLAAFEWIREELPEDVLILNNYHDAGLWLPAFTLRPAVVTHSVPFFIDELRAMQDSAAPTHVFLGKGNPAGAQRTVEREALEAGLESLSQIYDQGGATVYAARDPQALGAWWHSLPRIQEARRKYALLKENE